MGTVFSPCNILGEQTIERFAFSEKYSRETVAVRYFTFSVYCAQSIVIGLSPSFLVSVSPPPSQISHSPYLSLECVYRYLVRKISLKREEECRKCSCSKVGWWWFCSRFANIFREKKSERQNWGIFSKLLAGLLTMENALKTAKISQKGTKNGNTVLHSPFLLSRSRTDESIPLPPSLSSSCFPLPLFLGQDE